MERHKLIELMGQLKLAGMRAAYDEVIAAGLRAQHPVQRIIGELLLAQLADNRARSTVWMNPLGRSGRTSLRRLTRPSRCARSICDRSVPSTGYSCVTIL